MGSRIFCRAPFLSTAIILQSVSTLGDSVKKSPNFAKKIAQK
jgi:hypothetical protein